MTSLQADIADALMELEHELGDPTFTWSGKSYVCIPGSMPKQAKLQEGGFNVELPITMTVRTDQLPSIPEPETDIMYNDNTMRIKTVTTVASGAYIRLSLVFK